jgi:hypothetical protein
MACGSVTLMQHYRVVSYLEYRSHESALATSTPSLLLLVPPAALFVFGCVLLWVARGFEEISLRQAD